MWSIWLQNFPTDGLFWKGPEVVQGVKNSISTTTTALSPPPPPYRHHHHPFSTTTTLSPPPFLHHHPISTTTTTNTLSPPPPPYFHRHHHHPISTTTTLSPPSPPFLHYHHSISTTTTTTTTLSPPPPPYLHHHHHPFFHRQKRALELKRESKQTSRSPWQPGSRSQFHRQRLLHPHIPTNPHVFEFLLHSIIKSCMMLCKWKYYIGLWKYDNHSPPACPLYANHITP